MAKKKKLQVEALETEPKQDESELSNGEGVPPQLRCCDSGTAKKKKKKKLHVEALETEPKQDETEIPNGDGSHNATEKHKKKKKKRKREREDHPDEVDTTHRTVSIAIAGSIIDNTQSLELATRLAGQIARAATIFRVDEVVVFDSKSNDTDESSLSTTESSNESGAVFLTRILRYLETPQYLRKALFPMHSSLRFVGMLPPLDAPHHLRKHEWASYREGVTLKEKAPNSGTVVDVGLSKNVVIDQVIESGKRVTVAMGTDRSLSSDVLHQVVSSSSPRKEGLYWGYNVRYASNLTAVIKNCPYEEGYDYMIGTSEHGQITKSSELSIPKFRHLLISFGGLAGLEESLEVDNKLKGKKAGEVFSIYLNTCPNQGSRTIRTEEAIFISLQYLQEPISRAITT